VPPECLIEHSCVTVWQSRPGRSRSASGYQVSYCHTGRQMANLGKKNDVFLVRFRFQGREYKKSLKTRHQPSAQAALHSVELTLHRLHTGLLALPPDVDPGDFIVSGGTFVAPQKPVVVPPHHHNKRHPGCAQRQR
jgi:hypothetical protein